MIRYPKRQKSSRTAPQSGSSLVEFLIMAPVVMLMTYMAYDLNKRAEEMGSVSITSRNLAHRAERDAADNMRKIVARPFKPKSMQLDQPVRDAFSKYETSGNVETDYKIHHQIKDSLDYSNGASFGVKRDRLSTPASAKLAGDGSTLSYTQIQGITDSLMQANAVVDGVLTALNNAGLATEDGIRIGETGVLIPGKVNDLQNGLNKISNLVRNKQDDEVLKNDRSFSDRYFLRAERGYHTNKYTSNGLAGAVLGIASQSKWDGYSESCMNKFNATENCSPTNSFAYMVGAIGLGKSIATCVADFFSGGSASSSQEIAKTALVEGISAMMQGIVDKIITQMLTRVANQVLSGVSQGLENKFQEISNTVGNSLMQGGSIGGIEGIEGANTRRK